MGNAQVARVDEPGVLLSGYPGLVFQDVLGTYKLFKVMQCVHEREGPVVVKLFLHREGAPKLDDVQNKVLQIKDALSSQWMHPNVVPYQGMEITARSAILLRHHFARNLYDRIYSRPFLTEVTKHWIAFQVLCSVCQAHSVGVAHGDLKTENIFVSSWNHAILSDFAMFKPLVLPEDDPSEFSFFFESNLNRRRCYLAPERFETSAGKLKYLMQEKFSRKLAAMDVFSLGCVLAELFLEGQTLMDLPELLSYRSNQLDLLAKISCIKNKAVKEILGSMLSRDPSKRRLAAEYLREWCERVAPTCFQNCLFPLSVLMLHPIYQQPDTRILLIRHNFANLLWSMVGPMHIKRVMEAAAGQIFQPRQARDCGELGELWQQWLHHVDLHVGKVDEATLCGVAYGAAQAASQWSDGFESDHGAAHSERSKSSSVSRQSNSTGGQKDKDRVPEAVQQDNSWSFSDMPSTMAQPRLTNAACLRFMKGMLNYWEAGCKRCLESGEIDTAEPHTSTFYKSFLTELCTPAAHGPLEQDVEAEWAGGGHVPDVPVERAQEDDDSLVVVCGFICSSLQHLSSPQMKIICLDMLEQVAPLTSQSTVLEQIVPYCHILMTDAIAKVRARAIQTVTCALEHIDQLPPSDTPFFTEYLFPQLLSAMTTMSAEPVVLLAVAKNIGALAQHAFRFAELSALAAQRNTGESIKTSSDEGGRASKSSEASVSVEIEAFDVQGKHLRDAVKGIVERLLDYLPMNMQTERVGGENDAQGRAGLHEEALLNMAIAREVKIALLQNIGVLADIFGLERTHNFLLPYAISFMNDPAWEVRVSFLQEVSCLPRKVGHTAAQGIIWPCYEQALQDQEERVLEAALQGAAMLVSQQVLKRQSLVTIATKVAPLLVHPSKVILQRASDVFMAVSTQLSAVDQYVFVLPAVRPYLKQDVASLGTLRNKLVEPLNRLTFKRVVLNRDKDVHDALLHQKPLPATSEQDPTLASSLAALELCRPYVQSLLRSRPSSSHMTSGNLSLNSASKDEHGFFVVPPTMVQSLQYATVNPLCVANRSLHALTESDSSYQWTYALAQETQHALGLFSMHTYLIQALCLPPKPRELGSLSYLDGTPYSLYASGVNRAYAGDPADWRSRCETGAHVNTTGQDLGESQDPCVDVMSSVVTGLPGVAAMTSSDRRSTSETSRRWAHPASVEAFGVADVDESPHMQSRSHHSSWRPQGSLLATLYEYAHQSGVPVVKVDTTDDSRILITGGKDGVVKIWNCAALEQDMAVSSSHTFTLQSGPLRRKQRLRALRSIRNSKAVAIGSETGDVSLYKIEPSRTGPTAGQVCRFSGSDSSVNASSVMCIDQFDTELESLVIFAQAHGKIQGWDIRSHSPSWSLCNIPPWLGVPNCLALGSDGHGVVVGTLAGGLSVYDLRFLAPWKQWKVSSGAAVMSLKSTNFGPSPNSFSAFAAFSSDSNEVALFDLLRGSCITLFLTDPITDRPKDSAVCVPSLLCATSDSNLGVSGVKGITPEQLNLGTASARRSAGCVRSLWLPPRGAQTFLLAGGTDCKVRYWSLDPEHCAADAYTVTPWDSCGQGDRTRDRTTYSSNHLGDVFVVQEQSGLRGDAIPKRSQVINHSSTNEVSEARPKGTNPNHRDAILDMCTISLQYDILVTAGRDGLVKLWK